MQKQDQSLKEVQERLGEYEQRMDENQKSLMTIKDHLQFNERFTRMLTRENQVLQMKLAHKEQLFKSPKHEAKKSKGGQSSQENLRKEIHTLHEVQKSHESRYITQIFKIGILMIQCVQCLGLMLLTMTLWS